MTLKELVETLASDWSITQKQARGILDSIRWHINDLAEGEELRWPKLGVFQRKTGARKTVYLHGKKYCSFPVSRVTFRHSRSRNP